MSDLVHAKPDDVRKVARSLEHFQQQLLQVCKDATRSLDSVEWHDRQFEQFEAHLKDFTKRTNNFVGGEVKQMVKALNALAGSLEQAASHRF